MKPKIQKKEDEAIKDFSSMKDRGDLCNFFEINEKTLIYLLYRNQTNNYREFKIQKKSGGVRMIKAPVSTIKILQRKLSNILYCIINNHRAAHGFIKNRDIKTNALIHVKKNFVLNLDLKDFFGSINFGRVRGLFMSNLFKFNSEVSTLLAQLCCDENSLPQGAPTSPMLSNLICYNLDNQLFDLARDNYSNYTRYADDITFSFSGGKALKNLTNSADDNILSEKLQSIIEKSGFKINFEKVRLCSTFDNRQKVTGIVVNNKINLERKYIKKIRAILYSWKKYGIGAASTIFFETNKNIIFKTSKEEKFIKIIKGRLNFIKQIKGENNFTWRKLQNQFNALLYQGKVPPMPLSHKEEIEMASWVIESGEHQGTGFFIKDQKTNIHFITCAHVLTCDESIAYQPNALHKKFKLKIIKKNDHSDIAFCKLVGIDKFNIWSLDIANGQKLYEMQKIIITGYPNFGPGQQIRIEDAQLTGSAINSGVNLQRTNGTIIAGNSGGAVLNSNYSVIGMATYDKSCILGESAFLPIESVLQNLVITE